MRTLKLTLAYDGTSYAGWQRQREGASIQGLLEDALAALDGAAVTATGAGRTDAGVHALGQVASCRLSTGLPSATIARALNARLPADVRVVEAADAADDFHARFDAKRKTYVYRLFDHPVADPFERRYAWHRPHALDLAAMREALAGLVGTHDFAAFQSAGTEVGSTVRTVTEAAVEERHPWVHALRTEMAPPRMLFVRVTADGFLRHMVRTIVGSLVEVGRGRLVPSDLAGILASRRRDRAGPTAPAAGLFLVRVEYEK